MRALLARLGRLLRRILVGGGMVERGVKAVGLVLVLVYVLFFNYVEQYQVGLAWNFATGNLELQSSGFHVSSPFTSVSRIDTRPLRVCLTSAGRGYNCKLAQFDPDFYKEFVATEGHYYYWWANRFSFNSGYKDEYRGMKDLIRGYAFSSAQYPFVKTL